MINFKNYIPTVGLGVVFLFLPLLKDLHFESAFIASIIGCFWAGMRASKSDSSTSSISPIFISIYLIAAPLFIRSIIVDCFTWHGLGFWVLLPAPSIIFGYSVGRLFRKLELPYARVITLLALLFVGVGIFIMEFFNLPQVYYFNHVWGGWPGPIYDQTILVTSSWIFFRLSTLIWAAFLWVLPDWKKTRGYTAALGVLFLLLVVQFNNHPALGITTPRPYLQQNLYQYNETEHFRLFFDADNYNRDEVEYWSERHEFHFKQIVDYLEIDWPENRKIESYLYANAWQKKDLVGAKNTSYVPIWLEQDQLHIAKEHLNRVLKHELVHVISKQFGNRLFNGSWSIGLVEGLAEAIAADASSISTLDQIIAAELPLPSAEEMENALTFKGFYSSASSISYTTAGSFVDYLLEEYSVEEFKKAYQQSSFDNCYDTPFEDLIAEWHAQLPITEVDSLDQAVSSNIFAQQSVFQVNCPRKVDPLISSLDNILYHESTGDSLNAFIVLDQLYKKNPNLLPIKQRWMFYKIHDNQIDEVIEAFTESDSTLSLRFLKADAYLLNGDYATAASLLSDLRETMTQPITESQKYSFIVREDSSTWNSFAMARYRYQLPDTEIAINSTIPQKWLLANRMLFLKDDARLTHLVNTLTIDEEQQYWFDLQLEIINRLIFIGEFELSDRLINQLLSLELRERHIERVQEEQEWLDFRQSL